MLELIHVEQIEKFFLANGPFDWIAHEAGQVAVTKSLKEPLHDFNSNAIATFNLLETIRKYSPNAKIAFASTNKVYGKLLDLEVRELKKRYAFDEGFKGVEKQPLDFQSPYGCSKEVQISMSALHDLSKTAVFQSCIYGTRQFGLEDQGWCLVFIAAALGNQQLFLEMESNLEISFGLMTYAICI